MKRFLKVLTVLVVSLLLLASGVNATLGHLSRASSESSYTYYNPQGEALLVYNGDLAQYKSVNRPTHPPLPSFLHRT